MPTSPNHFLTSPMAVAVDHCRVSLKPPPSSRRCRLRSFPHPDSNLFGLDLSSSSPSSRSSFHRSVSTPCFASSAVPFSTEDATAPNNFARVEIIAGHRARGVHALVVEVAIAMASGALLVPASDGLGGAYILHSSNVPGEKSFAVVKLTDEQPPWRSVCGESRVREAAAYLLDHGGFSGVPATALIKISHPSLNTVGDEAAKVASIQRFVPHDFNAGDLGPSRFSISSVHRIGILDVRLLNVDRHAGNILVRRNLSSSITESELVPVDHGLCLPELLEDPYFEWLHWPQAAVPFSDNEAEYINSLDPYKDAEILRSELPSVRESSIRILILCTIFLKLAAGAGLCLADIGGMMTREFGALPGEPSALEALCKQVENSMNEQSSSSSEDGYYSDHDSCTAENQRDSFQFDMGSDTEKEREQAVLDIPLLLRSNKQDTSKKQATGLVSLPEEEHDGDKRSEPRAISGPIMKSVSFSAAEFNCEHSLVSFKGLSEEEWGVFLEKFEQLLPYVFEARRKRVGLKQRLGTSF